MAKKSKAGAVASGKVSKAKANGRSTKAKKASSPKKAAVEKIETEAALKGPVAFDPSDQQVKMRAYFISERRRRFALAGDANSDWLEAKRQLLAEIRH